MILHLLSYFLFSFIAISHTAFNNAVCIALGSVISLIIQLFTTAKSDFDLDVRAAEIQRQRDERKTLLRHKTVQLHNLFFVHEQLFVAQRIFIKNVSLLVGTYVHALYKKLAVLDIAVCILEIDLTAADAFDLGTKERNARLILLIHKIFVPRLLFCAMILFPIFFSAMVSPLVLMEDGFVREVQSQLFTSDAHDVIKIYGRID